MILDKALILIERTGMKYTILQMCDCAMCVGLAWWKISINNGREDSLGHVRFFSLAIQVNQL